jgi:hypothetical protein
MVASSRQWYIGDRSRSLGVSMTCLEITTMVGCPLKCTYCPQDQLRGTYGQNEKYLPLENFKLILSKVPYYVRIDFSGMAEPFQAMIYSRAGLRKISEQLGPSERQSTSCSSMTVTSGHCVYWKSGPAYLSKTSFFGTPNYRSPRRLEKSTEVGVRPIATRPSMPLSDRIRRNLLRQRRKRMAEELCSSMGPSQSAADIGPLAARGLFPLGAVADSVARSLPRSQKHVAKQKHMA